MVSEEIHHLEEVRHFATAVGQRKQGAWNKWESAKDRAVTWCDLKHMEPKKIKFPHKSSQQRLTNTSQPSCSGVNYDAEYVEKTASLKYILTGCEYALRSYTWRNNEVLEIFAEALKCCEAANKALDIINNRAIQFVKEGNISKIAHKNMHKPSLLEGCTD